MTIYYVFGKAYKLLDEAHPHNLCDPHKSSYKHFNNVIEKVKFIINFKGGGYCPFQVVSGGGSFPSSLPSYLECSHQIR